MAKKHLVIVESPAKAKTIGKYLGKDYEVKASMGHLRDLPKSKLGVDIEHDFEPVYQPIRGKEELISELKKAANLSNSLTEKEQRHRVSCNGPGPRGRSHLVALKSAFESGR